MKYCIGCIHLSYWRASDPYYYSEMTNSNGSPAELACAKGHWKAELSEEITQSRFQSAMEKADTCADFSERPPSESNGEPDNGNA
jgi:hypothetical protein